MFVYTTAIKKLRTLKKRIKVVPGGTSAGKTYGILPILIDKATKTPGLEISVVSETIPHLRKGALKDFLNIMKSTGRYIEAHYNRTLLTYTFSNGSYIEFFSADQEGKVRGPRRNILYINEVNNISFEVYHQLSIRTDQEVWLDFNPSKEFWVYTELAHDPDVEWLVLTYEDNEALSEAIINEILKGKVKAYINPNLPLDKLFHPQNIKNAYWNNWWRVYGLGLLGSLEGVIFTNWTSINGIPREARLIGYAIDFGFTNDPATLIALYKYNSKYIWHELMYRKGMTNGEIAKQMKALGVRSNDLIIADSAEPKSITEINQYGFRVKAAVKGKDSIRFGIDVLQEEDFWVTESSTNLIKELRNYEWDRDKEGKVLDKPIDNFNHCIDPMRYLATATMSKQKQRKGLRRRN